MGPSAPPNRLERPGSSLYLIDSIGVSSLSACLDRSSPRTCRVFYVYKSPCIENRGCELRIFTLFII